MSIDSAGSSHEQRSEDVRAWLAHELKDLIDTLKRGMEFDQSAGMTVALISAYRELGRLYQVSERPGGRGHTDAAVARMISEATSAARLAVLEEQAALRRAAVTSAASDVRESLIALSNKTLG